VASCVTDRPLLALGHHPSPRPHFASFMPANSAAPLRVGHLAHAVALFIKIEYQIDETTDSSFTVRIVSYSFRILEPDGREILVYHWHPFGTSHIRDPHIHLTTRIPRIGVGANINLSLSEMHIPTGFVTLADVVRLLITEFGVEPRRADWESILNEESNSPSL
jgi:hypothetical protein